MGNFSPWLEQTMFDLHCHSNFSDGVLCPADLFMKASTAGLRVLALTDHDTISGIAPMKKAALDSDITIINGIELSVRWKKYDIHILGLQISPDASCLMELIAHQNFCRIERAKLIGQCLETLGIEDAYQKAVVIAGHERVGRPHFAEVLLSEGVVKDSKAAFKQYLGLGKSAYVPTAWVGLEEAVAVINQSSGQAVIAHPLKYKLTRSKLNELIITFKSCGGVGMEVVSGEVTANEALEMAGLCNRYNLLASSGSDYHGDQLSRTRLGQQRQLPVNCTPIWQAWNI
jgi:predicted metal-dependent phosphoesterase TrpH